MGVCNSCGCSAPTVQLTEFDGHMMCPDCLSANTLICEDCGDRIWRSENERSTAHPLCSSCREEDYCYCSRCDTLIHNDSAHYLEDEENTPYCRSCYEIECDRNIHEYNYKPDPVFYGEGSRFFGVELEIDEGGEDDSSAEDVMYVGNRSGEHIYCKHDGSLHDGFEIVTHPMTLEYHMAIMPWKDITDKARKLGYTSHQAETCGLHIHVNRTSFGESAEVQDEAIGRILYFVERNWNELLIFSRRTQEQLNSWARRYGYKDQPKEMLEHAKKGYDGRYTCVNLTNYSTIEFRIFRGTLKLNTILATLQLVNHICEVAVSLSDEEVRHLSWSRFVDLITEPELIQYLKERRIYVNESIETEEEI
ncbi:MAG: zinc-binding protein [Clostridia bacterium]|nr:zinc-binding protein [Clostridia bacterium]